MEKILKSLFSIMLIAAISLCYGSASAQTYPTKPIRLIIPFPPGGSNDIVGRLISPALSERLGQKVVVENHGGAGSIIGTEIVAKSAPDGYTLLMIASTFASDPSFHKLPYDSVKSFVPVARLGTGWMVLVVHPSLPVNSVKDLIGFAKKQPGKLNFSSAGIGSFTHLAEEFFKSMAGLDFMILQFKGGGPSMIDLLGGHSQASIGSLLQYMPHIKSGKLRALGISGAERSTILPDVPTISEAGVPGYEANLWWGIVAPAGTPKAIIDRLHKEISVILSSAEIQKQFLAQGAEADEMNPAEFGPFIAAEIAKWARVVKEANIKVE